VGFYQSPAAYYLTHISLFFYLKSLKFVEKILITFPRHINAFDTIDEPVGGGTCDGQCPKLTPPLFYTFGNCCDVNLPLKAITAGPRFHLRHVAEYSSRRRGAK
jgi:hypothetical protein